MASVRWTLGVAVAVGALLMLTAVGCGRERKSNRGGAGNAGRAPSPTVAVAATAPAASIADLRTALLTLDAFGPGWWVSEPPKSTQFSAERGERKLAQAAVSFRYGPPSGGASVAHDLIRFRPGQAVAYLADIRTYLRAQQVPFPPRGDESFAIQSWDSGESRNTVRSAIWIRHGDLVTVLVQIADAAPPAIPTGDHALFERLVDLVERRISSALQPR
jgi:hypothetical protein